MLLPIKIICNARKSRRDGTSLIFIQYCCSSQHRVLLNSQIAIPASYFTPKKQCISEELPEEYGDVDLLNKELKRMLRTIEDLIEHAAKAGIENIGTYVKDVFTPEMDIADISLSEITESTYTSRKKAPDLFMEIDNYIISKEKRVSKKALCTFHSMKAHLLAYEQFRKTPITFDSFDYNFYEGFIDFLTYDYKLPRKSEPTFGLKTNTVGKTIKQLRIFIRDRVKRKIIQPIDLSDYKIPEEETDAIYLSFDEIAKIHKTDLSKHPHLIEYRDLFVLACLTGLRFSDFSTLRKEDLRNDMLYKKQEKSNHWVVIPMRMEAKEIFEDIFKRDLSKLTNPEFNRHIKTIGQLAGINELITFSSKKGNKHIVNTKPKHEWITTHTGRRSFCTNEFLEGTPVKLIMQISGHKNERDFYKYIRITPEESALKMQELWLARNNMQALKPKD